MILAGDIGGTNCRLIACDNDGKTLSQATYSSKAFKSLTEVLLLFLQEHDSLGKDIKVACFGLPGPVIQQHCRLTNLSWEVDGQELAALTRIPRVHLLNDLACNAYGLATLDSADLLTVNEGQPIPHGNQVIVAPGTGLGEAAVIFADERPIAVATEGGHTDFAPTSEIEVELLHYVARTVTLGTITYETLISGPGLSHIYDFFRERSGVPTPEWLAHEFVISDRSAAIGNAGLSGKDPVCKDALDLFVEILASECANMALKFLATGGVFLGGGIPPRIKQKFLEPRFLQRFTRKDTLAWLLPRIPIKVILNDKTAQKGAVAYALRLLHASP